jgi:hypothetical protein
MLLRYSLGREGSTPRSISATLMERLLLLRVSVARLRHPLHHVCTRMLSRLLHRGEMSRPRIPSPRRGFNSKESREALSHQPCQDGRTDGRAVGVEDEAAEEGEGAEEAEKCTGNVPPPHYARGRLFPPQYLPRCPLSSRGNTRVSACSPRASRFSIARASGWRLIRDSRVAKPGLPGHVPVQPRYDRARSAYTPNRPAHDRTRRKYGRRRPQRDQRRQQHDRHRNGHGRSSQRPGHLRLYFGRMSPATRRV